MSSLKSGALLSLFTGVTFGAMQRPARTTQVRYYDADPAPQDAPVTERSASAVCDDSTSLVALALTRIAA